jgi:uncharacterized damage-inducible protein DinB
MDQASTDLRFPIGRYRFKGTESDAEIKAWIEQISTHAQRLKALMPSVSMESLEWRYRPEGWTIRQVIHHMADSHMNSIIRFKLALTEDRPTIKPYDEAAWAELPDTVEQDIQDSVRILEGVHARLATLLPSLSEADLNREFIHPQHGRSMNVKELIGLYAWHGRHHIAHIERALAAKGRYNQ